MFMIKQFYSKLALCAIVGSAVFAPAQTVPTTKVKPRTGPRAVSVLEMDAKGQARMVPVTIIYYDKYYDASQYQANPVPMAAEPGNVYEVLQANVPIGFFTTAEPKEVRGNWVSSGTWKAKTEEVESKPAKVEVTLGKDDDRPVLKRHGETSSSTTSAPPAPPSGPDDPDRPTLKRPASQEPESQPNSSSNSPNNTTASAPRTAQPVDQDLTHDTNESDPDRPVLHKTQAGTNPTDVNVTMTPLARVNAPAKVAPQANPEQAKAYVAISDAQKTDYRPFAYDLKPEEKTQYAAKLQKLAAASLQKFALAHGGVKLPPTLTFSDFDVRAFDVDYSNNPELVFTASFTPAPPKAKPITYYLTLVARADASGDLDPIFAQVTDSTRLDAYPRLELVDAVDADGYGRGSLLFREYNDSGKAFVLYRVDTYNLTKLFEGASGE